MDDHPASVPHPGSYPLVVDPVVSNIRLSKVLMDGGSSLNILYIDTLEAMGIPSKFIVDLRIDKPWGNTLREKLHEHWPLMKLRNFCPNMFHMSRRTI